MVQKNHAGIKLYGRSDPRDGQTGERRPHHIATEEEFKVYRGNWWKRSNVVGSDTMPIRHRLDFKQALSTLHRLKKAEDEAYYQN